MVAINSAHILLLIVMDSVYKVVINVNILYFKIMTNSVLLNAKINII